MRQGFVISAPQAQPNTEELNGIFYCCGEENNERKTSQTSLSAAFIGINSAANNYLYTLKNTLKSE